MLGLSLRETVTLAQRYPSWPDNLICFDRHPVKAISSLTYYDPYNAQQTVASSNYRLLGDSRESVLEIDSNYSKPTPYDRGDAVELTYTTGYDSLAIPAHLKEAILLQLERDMNERTPVELNALERSVKSKLQPSVWKYYS